MNLPFFILLTCCLISNLPFISAQDKVVHLSGSIENNEQKSFQIICQEILGREHYSVRIDKNRDFSYSFPQLSSHYNLLIYGNQIYGFYANPGDSIKISIKNETIQLTDRSPINQIPVIREVLFTVFNSHQWKNKSAIDSLVLENCMNQVAIPLLNSLTEESDVESTDYEFWHSTIYYALAESLIEYGRKKSVDPQSPFYRFTSHKSSTNDLRNYKFYENYIGEYIWFLDKRYNLGWTKSQELLNTGQLKEAKALMNTFIADPLIQDIILARKVNENLIEKPEARLELLSEAELLIRNDRLKDLLYENQGILHDNSPLTLDEIINKESIGPVFRKIADEHAGKVIYIDVWGTSCKPCIAEFPYYDRLTKEFSDSDIEFVFLATDSDEAAFKKIIDKYDLKGTHFRLNEDQYIELTTVFNFNAIPRYLLIDQSGTIIDNNAKRPSSEELKSELSNLIN